jgi:uncharacterized damage-inducible protein DinB
MLRDQLADALSWNAAHATFDDAVADLPPDLRGQRPTGFSHSPWELLEHVRLAQRDILEFCRNPSYESPSWPDGYWPKSASPPGPRAWDESVQAYRDDRRALQELARDPSIELDDEIRHGEGQTYGRELLLAIDHTAYHVGQLVAVRLALGAWG